MVTIREMQGSRSYLKPSCPSFLRLAWGIMPDNLMDKQLSSTPSRKSSILWHTPPHAPAHQECSILSHLVF